jgi:hypothetical protein
MSATDSDWLDIAPGATITSVTKLPLETKRGKAAIKKASGKSRAWTCDGEYVWFRRKKANPATLQRLTDQIARGELRHVTTSDDVEIYKVLASSPFHRPGRDLTAIDLPTLMRETVIAACKRDFATFVDGLAELAHRVKNARYTDGKPADPGFAAILYQEKLEHVFNLIRLRGGPSVAEIDREVAALRARRKDGNGSLILLPPGRA